MHALRGSLVFAAGLLATAPAAAVPCAETRLAQRADAIAALREHLRTVQAEDPDDVPVAAQRGLEALKDQLTGLVAEVMACAPLADDAALKEQLVARVPLVVAGEVGVEHDAQNGVFGSPIGFRVERVAGAPVRLSVVTAIGLRCGDDDLFAVFEPEQGQWQERLRWRAPAYDRLDRAAGTLQVALSPRAADGRWHALVAAVGPACYSTWSELAVAVLRPGPTPDTPRHLADHSTSIWWGEGPPELEAGANAISVRYWSGSVDRSIYSRRHRLEGRFEGDRLVLAAAADSAQDQADAWLAEGADDPMSPATATPRRSTLSAGFRDGRLSFGASRACPDGTTEVAIRRDDGAAAGVVVVGGRGRDARVLRTAASADPACDRVLPVTDTAVWK